MAQVGQELLEKDICQYPKSLIKDFDANVLVIEFPVNKLSLNKKVNKE